MGSRSSLSSGSDARNSAWWSCRVAARYTPACHRSSASSRAGSVRTPEASIATMVSINTEERGARAVSRATSSSRIGAYVDGSQRSGA
ncbi:MAG: hypothetical protein AAFV53_04890 [Myxococcota bacterium]